METIKFLSWKTSNTIATFTTACLFWVLKSQFRSWLYPESHFSDFLNILISSLYKSRKYEGVTVNGLIKNIANLITIERKIANNGTKKTELHNNKWKKLQIRLRKQV